MESFGPQEGNNSRLAPSLTLRPTLIEGRDASTTYAAWKEYWSLMNTRTWFVVIDFPLGPYLPMYSSTIMGLRCSHRFSYGMCRNLASRDRGSKWSVSMMTETVT